MVRNPCRLHKIAESQTISNTISPSCTDGRQDVRVQLAEDAWVRAQISQVVRNGDLADDADRRIVYDGCVQRMRGGRGNSASSAPRVAVVPARQRRLMRRTTSTTTTTPTPASEIVTAGFWMNRTTPALRSSAILRGLARSARESTVDANRSRA